MIQQSKLCSKCMNVYPLTTDYFYVARKLDRNKMGWQSYCKSCWKDINLSNKSRRRKDERESRRVIKDYFRHVEI